MIRPLTRSSEWTSTLARNAVLRISTVMPAVCGSLCRIRLRLQSLPSEATSILCYSALRWTCCKQNRWTRPSSALALASLRRNAARPLSNSACAFQVATRRLPSAPKAHAAFADTQEALRLALMPSSASAASFHTTFGSTSRPSSAMRASLAQSSFCDKASKGAGAGHLRERVPRASAPQGVRVHLFGRSHRPRVGAPHRLRPG